MATAIERQQQHATAARELERFQELAGRFRRRLAPTRTATVPQRKPPTAPRRPSRPSSRPYATVLLSEIPWWQFAVRRAARAEAVRQAEREHERLLAQYARREREHAAEVERLRREAEAEQRLLGLAQQRLANGDPAAVQIAVRHALTTLPFSATLVALNGSVASVAVALPPPERSVPEREPAYTQTGKPTSRKLNQGERNDLFCEFICGAALAAARTGIAAATVLTEARVIVLVDRHGERQAVAHCAVRRGSCMSWNSDTDPVTAFYESNGTVEQAGRTRAVQPLDHEAELDVAPGATSATHQLLASSLTRAVGHELAASMPLRMLLAHTRGIGNAGAFVLLRRVSEACESELTAARNPPQMPLGAPSPCRCAYVPMWDTAGRLSLSEQDCAGCAGTPSASVGVRVGHGEPSAT